MYMSRVEVDVIDHRKIRELTHLGAFHNWVESCFPNELTAKTRSRKLWRLDTIAEKMYLLVISETQPDKARLERYGVCGTAETKNYDAFLSRISNGKCYRFRATLNPVRAEATGIGKRGRVVPEITVEQQLNYLESRAQKNGFQLVDGEYSITERKYELLKKQGQKPIRLSKAIYEGKLVVIDSEIFNKTLVCGIGKKKAYGFGMMTVIPIG